MAGYEVKTVTEMGWFTPATTENGDDIYPFTSGAKVRQRFKVDEQGSRKELRINWMVALACLIGLVFAFCVTANP